MPVYSICHGSRALLVRIAEEAMTPTLADRLGLLPRLDRTNARNASIPCKVCASPAPFFDVVDFNKCGGFYCFGPSGVAVHYHRCNECGFLFTPFFDNWTSEDFRRFIYNADYTLVDPDYVSIRPISVAGQLARLLDGHQDARILDYGAGRGVFAERMAALGFRRVESYDPFSIPTRPRGRFDIITCTEVIEHIPSPLAAFEDMQSLLMDQSCIILGETLQPPDICTVRGNWWYVAPRNGHVSTFADRTLFAATSRLGLIFHRGAGLHLFHTAELGRLADVARFFGPAVACYRLSAPADEPADGFHGVEGSPGAQFRWTATDTITWRITVPSGPRRVVQVSVPYSHESRRGFAAACTLDVGGYVAPVAIRESAIFAEAPDIAPGPIVVTLRTPELRTPPRDKRQLGLAVEAASANSTLG
jgi:hypothetical protein